MNWALLEKNVRKIQYKIYRASLKDDFLKVRQLQKWLLNSRSAKLLAVRQVTTLNKGRNTPEVEKQIVMNSEEKMILSYKLRIDGKAKPIRRVWIPKPGKTEKRPLGIATIQDRAKQALAKLALEPEWEARFESNSYRFRPGRIPHHAIEALFLHLRHRIPKWVFDADIRKKIFSYD